VAGPAEETLRRRWMPPSPATRRRVAAFGSFEERRSGGE
jgi:hypothetical protein